MINLDIIEMGEYIFKNYTSLTKEEKLIALDFRNKNREWMINNDIITVDEHLKWIDSLKDSQTTIYFLVFKSHTPFMAVDFHDIDAINKEAYWGYFLGNDNFRSEVLKIEKLIIQIAFSMLNLEKLFCINAIDNHVIKIHKFFGFKEDSEVIYQGRKFLKMYLEKKREQS
jgi:UDP-4-amino-4,6-dideoxy-N-acetyl-beta-L-altrosamine N-acetyltransferase